MQKRLPIVLLSNPRTGSSPLLWDLRRRYPLMKCYNEPILRHGDTGELVRPKETSSFSETLLSGKNFIVKIHMRDLRHYPDNFREILAEHRCYLIRLRRRDVVRQIASCYIEMNRRIWGYFKRSEEEYSDLPNHPIAIEYNLLMGIINDILPSNESLNSISYEIDEDCWYEDMIFESNEFIKTPKPTNYSEILSETEKLINEYKERIVEK